MSRRQPVEPLTPEQRLHQLKKRVFYHYALQHLSNKIVKHDENYGLVDEVRESLIESNGGRVSKAIRDLREAGVIYPGRKAWKIDTEVFEKEAPAMANLDLKPLQLNIEELFRGCMGKKRTASRNNTWDTGIAFNDIGYVELGSMSKGSILWAYFNQDKIVLTKKKKEGYTHPEKYLALKGNEHEVLRAKLLVTLFSELRKRPTEYLAAFCETKWVGKLDDVIYLHKINAENIIGSDRGIFQAHREVKRLLKHMTEYSDMLKHIHDTVKGHDRTEKITEYVKFMVKEMFRKIPLRLNDKENKSSRDDYRFILTHGGDFTFENLFPSGISMEMIEQFTKGM